MSDIFISYAHSTARQAQGAAAALRALGYSVWLDDDLASHGAFTHAIEEQLTAAKAALVLWSADAARSQWVLSEANRAREDDKLVQLVLDKTRLPMPFDQVQCADLAGWSGEGEHPNWRRVVASIAELVSGAPTSATLAPAAPSSAASPPLPEKPSIAVLPFADPSGATEGDYFADGMVDEIVTALGRFQSLFIIGSGSSLSYRERERNLKRIGEELGVRYLLEGSVRRSGPRVRISVSLVEAADGAQIWSDRFDGTLEDVFALQDEVANAVAARIEPTVQAADLRRGAARPTEDLGAYDLFLRGLHRFLELERQSWLEAIPLFEQAVARDSNYAEAWAFLAVAHANLVSLDWTDNPAAAAPVAQDAIRHALMSGGDDPIILAIAAFVTAVLGGEHSSSEAMADRALALNPGASLVWNRTCRFAQKTSCAA